MHAEGRECLVLTGRLERLSILQEKLRSRIENLFVLTGGIGKNNYAPL
jgi:hypothetical protein